MHLTKEMSVVFVSPVGEERNEHRIFVGIPDGNLTWKTENEWQDDVNCCEDMN
jgi:hypothetical protein